MTTASRENVLKAMGDAAWAPEGSAKRVSLLESAVREADALGDVELAYDARTELLDAACWAGAPDKMLACFAWLLAQCDRDPERFSGFDLLWEYKWVAGEVAEFPHIARAQIAAMLDDMEARFRRAGSTMRAVHQARAHLSESVGDLDGLRKYAAVWQDTARDDLSDCEACEIGEYARWLAVLMEDAKSLEAAAPLLRHELGCTEVPHTTFGEVLLPLFRLGRLEEAVRYHREGYRMVTKLEGKHTSNIAKHIRFLALTGNLTRGVELFQTHLPTACTHPAPAPRLRFFSIGALLFHQVARQGLREISLKTPDMFALRQAGDRYDPNSLSAELLSQARAMAAPFDRRNGNDYVSRQIEDELALGERAIDFPLSRVDSDQEPQINRG